ncbi:MAG: hypothetical protein M1832_000085 [Thelocarpon impressellum]|nr:MAG: hypothetical protein M1832_000085 [Thelocarpon impressellum]
MGDRQTRQQLLVPPINFAEVVPGIYRSGFPTLENFEFMKGLALKSILTLVPEKYPDENVAFMVDNSIRHFQVPIPGNKDTANISAENILAALSVVLDCSNLPIMIHCNKGKVSGVQWYSAASTGD